MCTLHSTRANLPFIQGHDGAVGYACWWISEQSIKFDRRQLAAFMKTLSSNSRYVSASNKHVMLLDVSLRTLAMPAHGAGMDCRLVGLQSMVHTFESMQWSCCSNLVIFGGGWRRLGVLFQCSWACVSLEMHLSHASHAQNRFFDPHFFRNGSK